MTKALLGPASAVGPGFLSKGSGGESKFIEYYESDYFLNSPKDGT